MRARAAVRSSAVLFAAALTVGGCVSARMTTAPPSSAAAPPPPPPPPPPLQGVESEGMRVEWAVEGDELRCVMSAPTSGWVRIGFNTVRAQHLANMIVGWVDAEGVHVEDRFATDPPYIEPDLQLGGSVDVTAVSGEEADGRTTVEFTLPLDSGDAYDLPLAVGQKVYLILSYGSDDDRQQPSVVRTAVEIEL